MIKKSYSLGISSALLAAIAAIAYARIYNEALGTNFSAVIPMAAIWASCMLGGLFAATGYWVLAKVLKHRGELVFNLLFAFLSFASLAGSFGATLPLDIASPELFPGLSATMHFFPVLAWHTLRPLFFKASVASPSAA